MIPKSPCPALTSYRSCSPTFPITYRTLLPGASYYLSFPCASRTQLSLPKSFLPQAFISIKDTLILLAESSRITWIHPSSASNNRICEVSLQSSFSLPFQFPNHPPHGIPDNQLQSPCSNLNCMPLPVSSS